MIKTEIVKLSKDNLLKIKEIDDIFYKNNITTLDWYLQRYNERHNGILLLDNDKCVGYLVTVPIKKELYDTITNGVIINDIDINPDMYINESDYNYIVSFVLLEEYQDKGYAQLLIKELFSNCRGNFCTLTVTRDGAMIASKYMDLVMKLNDNVSVFSIKI